MEVDGDEVGEGHIHHPGGIDVDEESIWVPVAEYRPDSRAIVYRIDRDTLEVTEVSRVDDHVGGIVHDRDRHRLVGQSWGSRRFYEWSTDGRLRHKRMNDSHFIDYQDCESVRRSKMLCSGVANLPQAPGHSGQYELGGLALWDLREQRIMHEVPVQVFSTAGHVVTRNPVDMDADGSHLTLWAAPDDSDEGAGTQILRYEADVELLK